MIGRLCDGGPQQECGSNRHFQTDVCGIAEAVVSFTNSFGDSSLPGTAAVAHNNDCHEYRYVNTSKSREVVMVLEEGKYLMGCSLNRCVYAPGAIELGLVGVGTDQLIGIVGRSRRLASTSPTLQLSIWR